MSEIIGLYGKFRFLALKELAIREQLSLHYHTRTFRGALIQVPATGRTAFHDLLLMGKVK